MGRANPIATADALIAAGEHAAALALLSERCADPALDQADRAEARVAAAVVALRMYDLPRVHALVAGAGDLPEPHASWLGLIDLVMRSLLGDLRAAEDLVVAIVRRLDGPLPDRDLRFVAEALALAVARVGRRDDLLEVVLRASGMAYDLGATDLVTAMTVADAAYRSRTDLAGAALAAARAVAAAEADGDQRNLPFALAQLANAQAGLGDPATPATADRLAAFGAVPAVATADLARGMYAWTCGDEDEAYAWFAELELRHGDDPGVGVSWHADLAALSMRRRDTALAARAAASVRSLADRSGMPWLEAAAIRSAGLVAATDAEAVSRLRDARARYEARGYTVTAARTGLDLLGRLDPEDPEFAPLVAATVAAFVGAGMTHWARRADESG